MVVAVDVVLADEDKGVSEDVEGDGERAADGARFELFVFEGLVAVVEDRHLAVTAVVSGMLQHR